jgi:hypothetical protein
MRRFNGWAGIFTGMLMAPDADNVYVAMGRQFKSVAEGLLLPFS